ncbi:hypothetical protein CHUAL_007768 [Chamberlinius hualienensis]
MRKMASCRSLCPNNYKDELTVFTISSCYTEAVMNEPSVESAEQAEPVFSWTEPRLSLCLAELTETEPEANEAEVRECGICSLRPKILQRFANIKVFVFLCCILVTLQQTLSSGYINSVITTIERRFDIPSGLSGGIASAYEVGNLVTIIFVSYLGSRRRIPVWMGVGVLVMGLGSLIFVLPHFVTTKYTSDLQLNNSDYNICRAPAAIRPQHGPIIGQQPHPPDNCIEAGSSNDLAVFIFLIAQLLIGCGASPLFTLGTTYIDDHVKRDSSSVYIGCMYSMVAFGPVCGFLLGGFLLSYYVDDFLSSNPRDVVITSVHPRWIGAWWGGFLIIGVLLLIVAAPFFAFPKTLRCEKKKVMTSYVKSGPSNDETKSQSASTYGRRVKDIPISIWKLISNPVYVVTCLGSCMELMIISGFIVFLPKYLETQYSLGIPQANIFTGGIAIPGACVGVFMGGYLIKKMQLSPKGAMQFVILFNGICLTLYILVFFLGCNNVKMAGATTPYFENMNRMDVFQVNLTSVCNMKCECSAKDIQPICGRNGLTYFSPCHAGCTSSKGQQSLPDYFNCACISSNSSDGERAHFQEVTVVPVATSGPCSQICHTIVPFMILLFVMSLAVSITQMPLLMIVLRSVGEEERAFALGMQFVIFRLFGYIPSPILFGNVIDSTCLVWKSRCSPEDTGFCYIYDIEQFRFRFVGICAVIKVLAAAIFWLDWYLIKRKYQQITTTFFTIQQTTNTNHVSPPQQETGTEVQSQCQSQVELTPIKKRTENCTDNPESGLSYESSL